MPLSYGVDVGVDISVTVTVTKVEGGSVLEGAGSELGEDAAAGVCVTTAVIIAVLMAVLMAVLAAGACVSTIVVGNVTVFVRKMVVGSSDSVKTDVATCVVVRSCVRVMRFVTVAVGAESVVLPPSTATTEYDADARFSCLWYKGGTTGHALAASNKEEATSEDLRKEYCIMKTVERAAAV